ncbi:MAG TPA: response regulator transcription factor [Nitrospiria bacterium]|jgi:DNA-binding NarL/FixJ family response regulator
MEKIRIFLADDQVLLRDGIRAIFDCQPGYEVVGDAGNGVEAIEKIRAENPDVLIIDIRLPGLNSFQVINQIHQEFPNLKLLVLTIYSQEEYICQAKKEGASGFLNKNSPSSELIRAVKIISRGDSYFSPSLPGDLKEEILGDLGSRKEKKIGIPLTEREQEVLLLIAEGLTNKEIAKKLTLSVKTIDNHRSNLMMKLGIHETAGLVQFAVLQGFIDLKK